MGGGWKSASGLTSVSGLLWRFSAWKRCADPVPGDRGSHPSYAGQKPVCPYHTSGGIRGMTPHFPAPKLHPSPCTGTEKAGDPPAPMGGRVSVGHSGMDVIPTVLPALLWCPFEICDVGHTDPSPLSQGPTGLLNQKDVCKDPGPRPGTVFWSPHLHMAVYQPPAQALCF